MLYDAILIHLLILLHILFEHFHCDFNVLFFKYDRLCVLQGWCWLMIVRKMLSSGSNASLDVPLCFWCRAVDQQNTFYRVLGRVFLTRMQHDQWLLQWQILLPALKYPSNSIDLDDSCHRSYGIKPSIHKQRCVSIRSMSILYPDNSFSSCGGEWPYPILYSEFLTTVHRHVQYTNMGLG